MPTKIQLPSAGFAVLCATTLVALMYLSWVATSVNKTAGHDRVETATIAQPPGQAISYKNRFKNGWSQGRTGQVIINTYTAHSKYKLKYHTINPNKKQYHVGIYVDGKLYEKKLILKGDRYFTMLNFEPGTHTVDITIDDTFNPKKLGMNDSDKDLGVKFRAIKLEGING